MAQLLVNALSVNALAPAASATLPHEMESNGDAVASTLIFPDLGYNDAIF